MICKKCNSTFDKPEHEHGSGRIYRPLHNGRLLPNWHLAYWGPDTETGRWREIRESARTPNEAKAKRLLRKRVQDVANHRAGRGRFVGPRQDRVTVRELLAALIRDYETRGLASLRSARFNVMHLNKHLGNELAIRVSRDTANRYIALRRGEGASDTTIDRETEKLGRAYQLAIDEGRMAFRPKFPRLVKMHSNARQGFFELAEFKAVVDAIPDADVKDFLWWMFHTGMRPKEVRSLTWEGFDRETWTLRLAARDAKTGVARSIPVDGECRAVVERRLAARVFGCPYIFHRAGRRMSDSTRMRAFRKGCDDAGVEGKITYDLRRTFVKTMSDAGVPDKVAMEISGHKTRSVYDRYRVVSSDNLRDAMAKYREHLAGLPRERAGDVREFK